jgi:hypothetical protein
MQSYQLVVSYIILTLTCCSCKVFDNTFTKVTIKEGQRFYAYRPAPAGGAKFDLAAYTATAPMSVKLRESGDALLFTADDPKLANEEGAVNTPATGNNNPISEDRATSNPPSYYYSTKEGNYPGQNTPFFYYRQWRVYLQGMAIPLKFRGKIDELPAQGTTPMRPGIPSQVETGPSIALAPGFKHSWSRYRGSKNALGLTTSSFSIAGGGLVGLGTVDVTEKTTQNKILATEASKNAIIPLGIHLVVGYNSLNVGVALGWDLITGPHKDDWVYKGKSWTGVIVGLDIIK